MTQKLKTAVLLTGAAARISQEVAMFDQLQRRKGLTVSPDDTLLAGFSSGSLNLAALNACFAKGSSLNWDTYYKQQVLFPLRNHDVYKIKRLPFDTSPLRATISKFVKNMGCSKVGDLAFNSYIITCSVNEFTTLWANSQVEEQKFIDIVDAFMASTAIPVLFPSQEIHCLPGHDTDFPDGKYVDGGTKGTFDEFDKYIGEYVRQNEQFDNMYIISPMREKSEEEHKELISLASDNSVKDTLFSKLIEHLKNISMITFLKFLQKLQDWQYKGLPMAKNIYVCIPEMDKNFFILNFDNQKKQYDKVFSWVESNPDKLAIPLDQFLKEHKDLL